MMSRAGDVRSQDFMSWSRGALPGEVTRIVTKSDIQKFFTRLFIDRESCSVTMITKDGETPTCLQALHENDELCGLALRGHEISGQRIVLKVRKECFVFQLGKNPKDCFPAEVIELHRRLSDRRSLRDFRLEAVLELKGAQTINGVVLDFNDSGIAIESKWSLDEEPTVLTQTNLTVKGTRRLTIRMSR